VHDNPERRALAQPRHDVRDVHAQWLDRILRYKIASSAYTPAPADTKAWSVRRHLQRARKNTYARDMGFTKIFSIFLVNISYIFCIYIRARARVSVASSLVDDGYSGRRAANGGP
jgi:hypothetical protein